MYSVESKMSSRQVKDFAILLAFSFAIVAATAFSFRTLDEHITKENQLRHAAALSESLTHASETIADVRGGRNAASPDAR